MATQWQGPHYIAILAASALAFGGGYLLAGRSRPPTTPITTNSSNGAEPAGIPGFGNEQAPRSRPDENELIARNAEPTDGGAAQGAGNRSRAQPEERRSEPPREPRNNDKPAPSESLEDDGGYDPGER
jgi:hypothetical protein